MLAKSPSLKHLLRANWKIFCHCGTIRIRVQSPKGCKHKTTVSTVCYSATKADLQRGIQRLALPPLTLFWCYSRLVSLQLPQGFDPLTLISIHVTNQPSGTVGQRGPITRLALLLHKGQSQHSRYSALDPVSNFVQSHQALYFRQNADYFLFLPLEEKLNLPPIKS